MVSKQGPGIVEGHAFQVHQKQGFGEIVRKIRTALVANNGIHCVAKGLVTGIAATSRLHFEVEDEFGPRFTADAKERVSRVLLHYPSFLEMRGPFGDTVLHDCILYLENDRSFYHSLARHLVDVGGKSLVTATYTHKSYYGETAAHLCCVNAYVALFKFLVANGADVAHSAAVGEFFLPYPQRENIEAEFRRRAQAKHKSMIDAKKQKQAYSSAMLFGYNLSRGASAPPSPEIPRPSSPSHMTGGTGGIHRRHSEVPRRSCEQPRIQSMKSAHAIGGPRSSSLQRARTERQKNRPRPRQQGNKELLLPPPEILEKITDEKACCYYGPFVVNFAACTGQMEMVHLCVAAGADITATDAFGNTILHCLVIAEMEHNEGCLFEVIKEIVKLCGPRMLEQRNHDGYDPLMLAVKEGNLKVFTKIVEHHQHVLWSFGPVRCFYVPLDSFLWQADQTVPSVMSLLGELPAYAFCDEPIPQMLLEKIWMTLKWQFFLLQLLPYSLLLASVTVMIISRPRTGWQQAHTPNAGSTNSNGTISDEGVEITKWWYDHNRINKYYLAEMASERYRLAAELMATIVGTMLIIGFFLRFWNHVTWVVHGGSGVYAGVKSFLTRRHNVLILMTLLITVLVPMSRYFFVEGEHVLLPLMAMGLCFHIVVDMQLIGGFGPVVIAMLASFGGNVTYFTLVFTLCVFGFALVVDLQEPRLISDKVVPDEAQMNQAAKTTSRFMRLFMSGFGGSLAGWDSTLWDTEDALDPVWMEFFVYSMWIVITQILFRSVIVAIMAHSFSVEGYTYEYVMWQKRASIISELLEWGHARKAVQRMLERSPDFMQVDPKAEFPLGWTCIRTVQQNRSQEQRKPWTIAGEREVSGYGEGGAAHRAFGKLRKFKRQKPKRANSAKEIIETKRALDSVEGKGPGKGKGKALGKGAPWNKLRANVRKVIHIATATRRFKALREAKGMVNDGVISAKLYAMMQDEILNPVTPPRRPMVAAQPDA